MGYRKKSTYVSDDPEKRANQLANLRQFKGKKGKAGRPAGSKNKMTKYKELQSWDIIEFATEGLGLELRPAQELLLRLQYGLPLPEEMEALKAEYDGFADIETGREHTEGVWCLGARSGKSFLASVIGLYEAICRGERWRENLRKGEVGYVVIVATRLEQSRQIIQRNAAQMLQESKLAYLLDGEPIQTEISLINGLKLTSMPCNSTAGRGYPIACLIFDEAGHFFGEGYAKADEAIYSALYPRLAQFPGAKMLMISTPAARQGLFWQFYKDGPDIPDRLVARATTLEMNPTIDPAFIERERQRDPDNAAREFDAVFADKRAAYLTSESVDAALQLAGDVPPSGQHTYVAGVDQSGLSGRDRFGFAIAHREGDKIIVDVARSWDASDSKQLLADIGRLKRKYRLDTCWIDRYARGWVQEQLQALGLAVKVRPGLPEVYANVKTLLNGGNLALPDRKDLREELVSTEAYYGRNNSLSIQHRRGAGGHGDLADAVAAAVHAIKLWTLEDIELRPVYYGGPGLIGTAPPRPESGNPLNVHLWRDGKIKK